MFFFSRVSSLFIKHPLELRWTSAWGLRRRGKEELRGAEAEGEGAHRGVTWVDLWQPMAWPMAWPMAYKGLRPGHDGHGYVPKRFFGAETLWSQIRQQKTDQILMWVWCSQIQWNRPYINDTGYLFVISTGLKKFSSYPLDFEAFECCWF